MADEQDANNDIDEGGDPSEISDYGDTTAAAAQETANSLLDDYDDDEPIEDYVVKLVVNEQPDGPISGDLVNAAVTDMYGNPVTSKSSLYDSVNNYATTLYDELNGNSTAIASSKRWWSWSTKNIIIAVLVALCILGIILAIVFLVLGKKFKKNKRPPPTAGNTTVKSVANRNISPGGKYEPVSSA